MRKSIIAVLLSVLLVFTFAVSAFALTYDESLPRIVDDADVFTDTEESLLNDYAVECREKYETDLVIAAVTTMEGKDIDNFAMDYFDYKGYGIGQNHDGIIMVICMEPGNHTYGICTTGKEIQNFTDGYIEYMYDEIGSYLSDGEFFYGAKEFVDLSKDAFEGNAKYDSYYDKYNYNSDGDYSYSGNERTTSKGRYDIDTIAKNVLTALVVGLIAGLIVAQMLKGQMKPVKMATTAKNYLVPGSLNVYYCREMFIRSDVTKTPIPKSNSSGGGSSHSGSSGRSHGGGGGRSF